MRIVVYPHDLAIGGSQLNAIEIAAGVQARGHEVVVFGRPGALVDRIGQLGLRFVESPEPRRRPSASIVSALVALCRQERIDVVHGYEWPPALEGWLAAERLANRTAAVTTVMSMAVAPFLPRSVPLVVGTEQIGAAAQAAGFRSVAVIEPPVDLAHNDPSVPGAEPAWSTTVGDGRGQVAVVMVTRLVRELKLEGILTAIDVVAGMAPTMPLSLVIVGDGSAREEVAERAAAANARVGRQCVVLTGEMPDPREAYRAADIVLGMGGSALRALAFGKPLIVQGERGFWSTLTPETLPDFLWTGWYGVGAGHEGGAARLEAELRALLDEPGLRHELGSFGRRLVEERFSLDAAADAQIEVYRAATAARRRLGTRLVDGGRSSAAFGYYKVRRKLGQTFGRHRVDDFNSKPLVAVGPPRPDTGVAGPAGRVS